MTRARARSGEPRNNERHRRSGHLLHGRYQGIVVEADPHLAERFGVPADGLIARRSRHRQARCFLLGLCYDVRSGPKSLAEIGMDLGGVGAAALCRNRRILDEDLNRDSQLARIYEAVLASFRR